MAKHWITLLLLSFSISGLTSTLYYGTKIGTFTTLLHEIKGDLYLVDDKTIFIKKFNYDGKSPDAYFWAGSSPVPDTSGFVVYYNKESKQSLGRVHDKDMILQLPNDTKIEDIRWLSVWSKKYLTSFGSVIFHKMLVPPRSVVIGPLQNTKRGVSSGNILILDSQTFLIPDFNYEGSGKGVHWWLSKNTDSKAGGLELREDGRDSPLQDKSSWTVIVTVPDGHSVFDYKVLSVWSTNDTDDYGSVLLPDDLNVPPSPRTIGFFLDLETNKLNCEVLNDNLGFEIRWIINKNDIIIHLVGNMEKSQYMALGLSKDDTETKFDSSDAVVAWIDSYGEGHALDYYFESIETCENGHGICPNTSRQVSKDNIELINGTTSHKTATIVINRPLKADDQVSDQTISTDGPQAIFWGVGRINERHLAEPPELRSRGNLLLDFGREPIWNCPQLKEDSSPTVKHVFEIRCPSDHVFKAQLGPSDDNENKQVWYINGLPAPKLTIQRGVSYTFFVEGGNVANKHHSFYITNSKEGGYIQKVTEHEEITEEIFAGAIKNEDTNVIMATTDGRLCEWKMSSSDTESFVGTTLLEYMTPLTLFCEPGIPGNLTWIPDSKTPNIVYYQSFSKKGFGGEIKIVDFCEESNPFHYLENEPQNIYKLGIKNYRQKQGLEQEENFFIDNEKRRVKSEEKTSESLEKEQEFVADSIPYKINPKNGVFGSSKVNELPSQVKNWKRTDLSDINIEKREDYTQKYVKESSGLLPDTPLHFSTDSDHHHDESERADRNTNPHNNLRVETTIRANNNRQKDPPSYEESAPHLLPSQASSQNSIVTKQNSLLKPHFEGGFIPLVLNPVKEKELSLPQFPPSLFHRQYKPFLFNESIPFHGTFKPGVPDFSGFNISSYSQEDSSFPFNYVADNIPMLSASQPQMLQNQIPPVSLHADLFKIQNRPIRLLQKFRYNTRPYSPVPQHTPSLGPLLNLRLPGTHDDLDQVSSQRVPVSYQSTGEEKSNKVLIPSFLTIPIQHRRQNKNQPKNVMHSPPIQRRPDFVNERLIASNLRPPKQSHTNYPHTVIPINVNKNLDAQKISSDLQASALRPPYNVRRSFFGNRPLFRGQTNNGIRKTPPLSLQKLRNDSIEKEHIPPHLTDNKAIVSTITPIIEEGSKTVDFEKKLNDDLDFKAKLPSQVSLFGGIPDVRQLGNQKLGPHLLPSDTRVVIPHIYPLPISIFQNKNQQINLQRGQNTEIIAKPHIFPHSQLSFLASTIPFNFKQQHGTKNEVSSTEFLENNFTSSYNPSNEEEIESVTFQSDSKSVTEERNEKNHEFSFDKKKDETREFLNADILKEDVLIFDPEISFETTTAINNAEAPFGARLRTRPSESRPKQRITSNPIPKSPLHFLRKSELSPFRKNLSEINKDLLDPLVQQISFENLTSVPNNNQFTLNNDKQNSSIYFSMIPKTYNNELLKKNDSQVKVSINNDDNKLYFQIESEYVPLYNFPGRKNIIPQNSNTTYINQPARIPENLNLPHISEKNPSHDNRTDYSILNHVLSIIGSQPGNG